MSAVAYVSDHLLGKYDPVPIVSTGTFAKEKTLHFSGPNPLLATIFTFWKLESFKISLNLQTEAADTPVPIKYLNSCSVR